MATATVISDSERQRMRDLHAAGKSRNEIARELDRSVGSVTAHCRKMGLKFDREATKAAVAAHQVDMRSWRAQKLIDLAGKIDAELAKWDQPAVVYNIGGRENVYTEYLMTEPPAEMRYTMSRTIGLLMDQHLKIADFDAVTDDHSAADVDGWLAMLTAGEGH